MSSRNDLLSCLILLLIAEVGLSGPAKADAGLAQQLQNPVANLISFPIQSNFDFNVGPSDGFRTTTNIQPVIPFTLNEDWNLISRTIVPVIYQNDTLGNSGDQFGLSDTLQSFFLSPAAPKPTTLGNLIWGAGPAIAIPTSTDRLLGPGTFGMGPTGVILFVTGNWTYGALANHVWGVADTRSNARELNATFLQPFVAYTTQSAWTYSVNTELTYDWRGEEWAGPINFALSKLTKIGNQSVQFQGRLRWWAADTAASPEGLGFTFNTTFVFPTK